MKKTSGIILLVLLVLYITIQAISTIPVAVQIYKASMDKEKLYYNAEVLSEEEAKRHYPRDDDVEYIGFQYEDWDHSIEGEYNRGKWYAFHSDDKIRFVVIPVGTLFKKDSKVVYIWLQDIVNGIRQEGNFDRLTYRRAKDGWNLESIVHIIKP